MKTITIAYHTPTEMLADKLDRDYVLDLEREGDFIAVEIFAYTDPPNTFSINWVDPLTDDDESPAFATLQDAVVYAHQNAWAFARSWVEMLDEQRQEMAERRG